MSQNEITPYFNDYLVCPYNNTHRLVPNRLNVHLTRCARNYPSSKLVRCTFNNTHLYSVDDMKSHIPKCPDRETGVKNMQSDKMSPTKKSEPQKFVVECTEDWDNEPPAPTYNPQAHCNTAYVILTPQGAQPKQRREFREKERMRLLTLRNKTP